MFKKICPFFVLNLSRKNVVWIMLAFILVGIAFRIYRFSQQPTGLYWDEIAMAVDASAVSKTGNDMHGHHWLQPIFVSYGDYKLPIYIWFSSIVAMVSASPEIIVRLPSLIAGLGTIAMTGLIGIKLFSHSSQSKNYKLLTFISSVFIIAISPTAMHFSRVGFEAHLGQFILAMAVYLALFAKLRWHILAQVMAVIATNTYYSIRFVWPIIYLLIIVLDIPQSLRNTALTLKKRWPFFAQGAILFSLYWLMLIPMQNSVFYNSMQQFRLGADSILTVQDWAVESNQLREEVGNSFVSRIFYHRDWLMLRQFLSNLSNNMSLNTIFIKADNNLRHSSGNHGLFFLPFLPILIWGLFKLFEKNKLILLLLVCWWLVGLVPASVPMETPHSLRSLNSLIPLSLMIAFGWLQLVAQFSVKQLEQKTHYFFWGLVIALLFSLISFYHYYFYLYPLKSADYWQTGYKQTALETCQQAQQQPTVLVNHHDQRFFLWILGYCSFSQNSLDEAIFKDYQLQQLENIKFL